jgi:hypothetical protein
MIAAHAIPARSTVVAGLFLMDDLLIFERDRTVIPRLVAVNATAEQGSNARRPTR